MANKFLISIDLSDPPTAQHGLDLEGISFLGRVYFKVGPETFEKAVAFIEERFQFLEVFIDCTALKSVGDIVKLLNVGASKVLLSTQQYAAITQDQSFQCQDHSRLVDVEDRKPSSGRYVMLKDNFLEEYIKTVKAGNIAIIAAEELTTDHAKHPNLMPVYSLITSIIHSDRADGLFPTVVSDERGICLGLVYSDEQSIEVALQIGRGVYHSRSRNGLWIKGEESGDTQELIKLDWDCDADALQFKVRQRGNGFCHLKNATCFGTYAGLSRLERTLQNRKRAAPAASYTSRLFNEPQLLRAKIMEEAGELCEATSKRDIAAEAADLMYFAMTKCTSMGVSLADVESNLDLKSMQATRRKGDAKPQWAQRIGLHDASPSSNAQTDGEPKEETVKEAASVPKSSEDLAGVMDQRIRMQRYRTTDTDSKTILAALQRPSQKSTESIMKIIKPIVDEVRAEGDAAVLKYTHRFEKATSLTTPVLTAPFPKALMQLPPETIDAINISFDNIRKFHAAQKELGPLQVETMPGVVCSRFSRPIERVGLYVPGGTAVLPSTALMLGVPAMVAGCKRIIIATPPRQDGTVTPEIIYIADKIGAESIVLAGGAQAVAAMAYGTESISKVDKILGPGNQFVTAGKMLVSNDTTANVSVDMPAGPSEVLVIADRTSNPAFVASDLLSQAEHGIDSQVICIAIGLDENQLQAIENELDAQGNALPRVDIVRGAIQHSVTVVVNDVHEAMELSNRYAPEHLILQIENAEDIVPFVQNAGSVFVGPWTPESVGDYSAGVNHSLRRLSSTVFAKVLADKTSSNVWLRSTILRSQFGVVCEAHHKLYPDQKGLGKCRRCCDAARKSRTARGSQESCQHKI